MDFDIGTIIYIIITIVAIVAGARGKKKKPTQSPSQKSSGAESKIEGFFNRLGVQLEGLADQSPQTEQVLVEEENLFEEDTSVGMISEEQASDEGIEGEDLIYDMSYKGFEGEHDINISLMAEEALRSTEDQEMTDIIDLDYTSNSDFSELLNDFDLQTAVIYSTILNRVEY